MPTIKVYTKDYCSYCHSAKALLSSVGADYEEIDITATPEVINELVKKSGLMTVPQIFVDGKCLGGSDDIHAMDERGELKKALGIE